MLHIEKQQIRQAIAIGIESIISTPVRCALHALLICSNAETPSSSVTMKRGTNPIILNDADAFTFNPSVQFSRSGPLAILFIT